MSKYTPGPWRVTPSYDADGQVLYQAIEHTGEYRGSIASVFDGENIDGITVDERDANARLISAAPDLLAALQAVLRDAYHPTFGTITAIEDAIVKATGEASQ